MKYQNQVYEISAYEAAARPRERLLMFGASRLSDRDLISLLVGSGIRGSHVEQIAEKLLTILDKNGYQNIEVATIRAVAGIGEAKAAQICAALEFSRRRYRPGPVKIRYPQDVLPVIRHFADRKREHFLSISLNGAHEVISTRVVSIGLVNKTIVHPREVFAEPLQERSAAVIAAHNHPSGNLDPSDEDREVTSRLKEAGLLLGIPLLDHIIFTQTGHYSFLEHAAL